MFRNDDYDLRGNHNREYAVQSPARAQALRGLSIACDLRVLGLGHRARDASRGKGRFRCWRRHGDRRSSSADGRSVV